VPTAVAPRKSLTKIPDEVEFYDHQIEGCRLMAQMGSFLLADEMGLGKTLQALTVAAIDFELGKASRVLIVSPATLKGNWRDEIHKFTRFTCDVLDGTPSQRQQILDRFHTNEVDILITNYEQVRGHLDDLNRVHFDIIIMDEAHYIKNRSAARTKACHKLRAKRFFLLTGSPLLNQVNELWSLLHRIDPAGYTSYWRFVNRYCVFGGYKDKQIVGVKNRAELMMAIEQVMIRRLKKNVLTLPEKQRITIHVDLHPEQEKLYKQVNDELRLELSDDTIESIDNHLTKFLRLKMICGSTGTLLDEDHSLKLDWATEMVEEITHSEPDSPGRPVVLFTQFRDVQRLMAQRLEKVGVQSFLIHGDVPALERPEVVKTWADFRGPGDRPAALIVMLQVGGIGLNMTAADTCIFLDKLWVPKLNEQAEDRLHRIGADLTKPIQIYEVIVNKTIESRIETILRRKSKLFDSVVESSEWKKRLMEALMEDDSDDFEP
jgi:SNF2 family DNA or RNA helicase